MERYNKSTPYEYVIEMQIGSIYITEILRVDVSRVDEDDFIELVRKFKEEVVSKNRDICR